ncbi:MAG: sugar ABC transporter permease [bacterium]|nr:sugar ABC transporter permease [bacterium]
MNPASRARLALLAPMLGLAFLFQVIPLVGTGWLALHDWDLLGAPRFVGLASLGRILEDPAWLATALRTGVYVAGTVTLEIGFGLALACGLAGPGRGRKLGRLLAYSPSLASMVAIALVWGWLLDASTGGLNGLLRALGLTAVPWLLEPGWALASVIFVHAWKGVGTTMLLLLAGLATVPEQVHEAARLDGASSWQTFWHVTLPLLGPALTTTIILDLLQAAQAFDHLHVLTAGGPVGSTTTWAYAIWQTAFQQLDMGFAAALGLSLAGALTTLVWALWQVRTTWEASR